MSKKYMVIGDVGTAQDRPKLHTFDWNLSFNSVLVGGSTHQIILEYSKAW